MIDLVKMKDGMRAAARPRFRGNVEVVSGVLVEAEGIPAAQGELCRIDRGHLGPIDAEVVGFRGTRTLLMPHGDVAGIAPQQTVTALGRPFSVAVGDELLGRVLDGFGLPLDGRATLPRAARRPVRRDAPKPGERKPIDTPLPTGVRVLDGMCTLGRGQRMGIFAGSGVGKSTLLGQITRGTAADVIVVCLVGERGREVQDFLDQVLGKEGLKRAVTVVATSDRSPIERFSAPFVATTVAEHFRDQGLDVLMVMDSVTRFAAAAREIGLAAGEPPTVRGYPPSFFATVPKLVERMGRTSVGSITALLTVLMDADDPNEPVADTMRGLLDGHLMLSRDLAHKGHFPAIDVLASLSRLMPQLASPSHLQCATIVREDLAAYESGKDLVDIGAYRPGANLALDRALTRMPVIDAFLRQGTADLTEYDETTDMMSLVAKATGGAA
jgi:flagellum-specific ATP synthase